MQLLTGWGRHPVVRGIERLSEDLESITDGASLTRGLGRSYGDASLPAEGATVAGSRLADRVLAFDTDTGRLRGEPGLSLGALNRRLLPLGWSSPVHTGTQFVTLGGMVAADVHGKNHHVAGCLGRHVESLRMRLADGTIRELSEADDAELFHATQGGMGLTGHILEVSLRLHRAPTPWIHQEIEPVADSDEMIERLRTAGAAWPFTVCWVDCAAPGRAFATGALIKGRWAEAGEGPQHPPPATRELVLPLDLPGWVLNRTFVGAFNRLYGAFQRGRSKPRIVSPDAFFHPLDLLRDWNRLYGRRGFTQYQCVLPAGPDESACCRRLFDGLARRGGRSYLTVVKDCGAAGKGMLSFPMPGISVAFDLPLVPGWTQETVDALNEIVIDAGGRIYLAKDALTRAEHFRAMEPRLDGWLAVRRRWDPERRLQSALSRRLLGDVR